MTNQTPATVFIAPLAPRHLAAVADIEAASFDAPWSLEQLRKTLARAGICGRIAVGDSHPRGFVIYELQPRGIIVHNIAVHPDYRRLRIASQLLDHVGERLHPDRRTTAVTCVNERNLPAQLLLRRHGWAWARTIRQRYGPDDGYVFSLTVAKQ